MTRMGVSITRISKLNSLDLSNNLYIEYIEVVQNQLFSLNIQNGNNTSIGSFNTSNNPALFCILVDDINFAKNQTNWTKDDQTEYATYCEQREVVTYVPDDNFEQTLIDLGYDDVLDDYVLTTNINDVKELTIIGSATVNSTDDVQDFTGIQDFVALEYFNCEGNAMTELDVSQLLQLKTLICAFSPLESLDISKNLELEELQIPFTKISEVDLSKNNQLLRLFEHATNLTELDLSNNSLLSILEVGDNQIEQLYLPQNGLMERIQIRNSKLKTLDVSNVDIERFVITQNPDLVCIKVTDIDAAIARASWYKDESASYSLDCSQLGVDGFVDNELGVDDKIKAYPTITNGQLSIDNPNKDEIGTVSIAAMNGNTISVIPVHDNPREVKLDISGNSKGMYIIRIAKMSGKDEFVKVVLD